MRLGYKFSRNDELKEVYNSRGKKGIAYLIQDMRVGWKTYIKVGKGQVKYLGKPVPNPDFKAEKLAKSGYRKVVIID